MKNVAVIIGQGYVGLPLAKEAAEAGWQIWGLDRNRKTVDSLNKGISHIDDLTDQDIAIMLNQGYRATCDEQVISSADVVVVCVPTPLKGANEPDLGAIETACKTIAANLSKNTLIILESTTYPGTTDDICVPLIEEISGLKNGAGFEMAFSPERVDPGSKRFGIKNTAKLVGGTTDSATQRAAEFYRTFVHDVVPMKGAKEAETAKLLENTFRHVNIALINEMARFCHELKIDIWDVINGASTKPFGFMPFRPSAGVGGHCIPIDPNYLSYEVKKALGYPFRFVDLAQEINATMPAYVVRRASDMLNEVKKPLNGAKVLLLGVTYKPNIADQRESPSYSVARHLIKKGAMVSYHDPFVPEWSVGGTTLCSVSNYVESGSSADLVILLQAHNDYDREAVANLPVPVFDTCGVLPAPAVRL